MAQPHPNTNSLVSDGDSPLTLKLGTKDGGKSFYTNDTLLGGAGSQAKWGIMDQKFPYSGAAYARIIELSMKYNFEPELVAGNAIRDGFFALNAYHGSVLSSVMNGRLHHRWWHYL